MTIKVDHISKRDYNLHGIMSDEQDALESMLDKSGHLCDAISETADNYTPIYNGDIWEKASDISEYIEDAISEGLAPTETGSVDLMKIFQSGYYVYYNSSLYNNLDTIAFNYIAEKINEHLNGLDSIDSLDLEEIENAIESETESTDNNDTFDDLDDKVNDIIERMNDDEFVA